MGQSDIENKVELAALRHLNACAAFLSGVSMYSGANGGDKSVPNIVCNAAGAENYPLFTDCYWVDLEIVVESQADDTTSGTHGQRVGYVRDQFNNDWAGLSLSGFVSDFAAMGVVLDRSNQTEKERSWITTIPVRIWCKSSD